MTPRPPSPKTLPGIVEKVKQAILSDPSHEFFEIAKKLFLSDERLNDDPPDLAGMWQTLYSRHGENDDHWVWSFLSSALSASKLPAFHHKTARERKDLAKDITNTTKRLCDLLTRNGLDGHLVHVKGLIYNGFFIYEDLGYSNQRRIDESGEDKLKISVMITKAAERAKEKIEQEPRKGKGGKNALAIRFARSMVERNKKLYHEPLYTAVATATNALYATKYDQADIHKLVNR